VVHAHTHPRVKKENKNKKIQNFSVDIIFQYTIESQFQNNQVYGTRRQAETIYDTTKLKNLKNTATHATKPKTTCHPNCQEVISTAINL